MTKDGLIFTSWIILILAVLYFPFGNSQALGSCDFDDRDWLCGYSQDSDDTFDWQSYNEDGNTYITAEAIQHTVGGTARLTSPVVKQQDTHCFSFDYRRVSLRDKPTNTTSTTEEQSLPAELRIYVLDVDNSVSMQPVWISPNVNQSDWLTVYLAVNPQLYQVVFEAVILQALPGIVAIDNIKVSSSACDHAPYFLRLGDKEVNAGQNQTLQCLLWGSNSSGTAVKLQKSTGEMKLPQQIQEYDEHIGATFVFTGVTKQDSGTYRCLSSNHTRVGVSNYAQLSVQVPPTPRRGPKIVKAGPNGFIIELNAEDIIGDGPVVQKILRYRPFYGDWSDVHHITTSQYQLWHLQPDTKYELTVSLVRPGLGGSGPPGPILVRKTKCDVPARAVQGIEFKRVDSTQLRLVWDIPDFSVTQCHHFTYVVKYRKYVNASASSPPISEYKMAEIKEPNVAVLRPLEPFTMYVVQIELSNVAGSKATGDYTVRTGEAVPGPVPRESLVVSHVNESSVTLEWGRPMKPNGNLTGYQVSYTAQSSSDPSYVVGNDNGLLEVGAKDRRLRVNLHPGTKYLVGVKAKTQVGYGPAVYTHAKTSIAAPVMPRYPPAGRNSSVTTPTTIEITIIPADANGAPVTNYFVIIEDVTQQSKSSAKRDKDRKRSSGKAKRKRKKSRGKREIAPVMYGMARVKRQAVVDVSNGIPSACEQSPVTYETAQASNSSAYAGARFNPDQLKEELKFVVGDNSENNGFSNPPLDPEKDYKIYVRAESSVNGKTKVSCVLAAIKSRTLPTTPPARDSTPGVSLQGNTKDGDPITVIVVPGGGDSDERNAEENDDVLLYAAISGAVVGVLIIAVVVIFFVVKLKKRKKLSRQEEVVNPFEVHMMMSDMNATAHTFLPSNHSQSSDHERLHLMPDLVGYDHQDATEKGSLNGGTPYAGTSNDERFAVRVDDLHAHVSQMKADNGYGFHEEFLSLPDGSTAACSVADASLNKSKNRYGNIKAYDHSRVVLDPAPGFEEEYQSDYINASYIDGYKNPNMYIATQGPTAETLNDFWWMIWQEKSHVIVMVTNLVELGKIKSEKYWPDDRDTFGCVQVSLTGEEHTAGYVVRSFVLQQVGGYDARDVKQFHFTSWPDHGVPAHPTGLLSYVRRVKAFEHPDEGPTVVHCSAGSGRTGCYIVIDMMLDMARDEELVDIHNTVRDLRTRRINMVQTEEQYVFIHEAVLEAVVCGETSVNADDLVQHYDDLITVDPQSHFAPIQEEFETLHVLTPKLKDEECSVARLPRNKTKNRFMDVLPADRHLAYLATPDPEDRENNYINAVFADSYTARNHFLVTQMPLPNTVADIWRLIYDYKCNSVIMMNDPSEHDENCAQYWPEQGSSTYGPFFVELLTKDDEVDVITRLFKLQNTMRPSEDYRLIQQFQLTNWPGSQPVPHARNSVLRVVQLTNNWQNERAQSGERGRALVHCVAGAGRSGTFVACYNMCEQMRQEYSVDVFNIVQRLRNVRPQFVETLEQYRFCYEVGIEFADH